jgi:hypothetical protein
VLKNVGGEFAERFGVALDGRVVAARMDNHSAFVVGSLDVRW